MCSACKNHLKSILIHPLAYEGNKNDLIFHSDANKLWVKCTFNECNIELVLLVHYIIRHWYIVTSYTNTMDSTYIFCFLPMQHLKSVFGFCVAVYSKYMPIKWINKSFDSSKRSDFPYVIFLCVFGTPINPYGHTTHKTCPKIYTINATWLSLTITMRNIFLYERLSNRMNLNIHDHMLYVRERTRMNVLISLVHPFDMENTWIEYYLFERNEFNCIHLVAKSTLHKILLHQWSHLQWNGQFFKTVTWKKK